MNKDVALCTYRAPHINLTGIYFCKTFAPPDRQTNKAKAKRTDNPFR